MERVAETMVAEARQAGLDVRADQDRLVVRGPRRHEALADQLLAHKAEVLALLASEAAEIAWRVEAMRPQVPPRGAIPLLVARDLPVAAGRCLSCGEPIAASQAYRCRFCVEAARTVLGFTTERSTA